MSSDPDSDDGDGEGGNDITASEQADKPFTEIHDQRGSRNKLDCKGVVCKRTPLR
jgi:hypothetical protein